MSKTYRMSVIIPCFNHGEFLQEAVGSVKSAKRDDLELIVVDDGSADERTRKEMDTLRAQGIKVIRQENKGLAAARNAGIAASHGEFVFPLDADDRMRPGWIDRAMGMLDSDAKVGVVYGDAQCFGARTDRWHAGAFERERLLDWNFINASALYRRSVWEQNGGYDGTMPVQGFEDWDFWVGALENGWQFAYIPEVFFEYRRAEQSMTSGMAGFDDKTREFVARKHGPLYREAWLRLADERLSIKRTFNNLNKLVKARLKMKLLSKPGIASRDLG